MRNAFFNLIGGCTAADIEEVRGRAASVLDDVHCGHGEPSAVDHTTHAAIELDVVEAVLRSFDFERIFFVEIAEAAKFLVTKEAVCRRTSSLRQARPTSHRRVRTQGLISSMDASVS